MNTHDSILNNLKMSKKNQLSTSSSNEANITKPVRKRTNMDELITNELSMSPPGLIDKGKDHTSINQIIKENEPKFSSNSIPPQLVKYKINPKSDEYNKWRVIKAQYAKHYANAKENQNDIRRRSQTALNNNLTVKSSIITNTPSKDRDRTPTLFEKNNNLTPSHKKDKNEQNFNDSMQSIKDKPGRANTSNPLDLMNTLNEINKEKEKSKMKIIEVTDNGSISNNEKKDLLMSKKMDKKISYSPQQLLNLITKNKKKHSYIEEYLKRIHILGKKELYEVNNDFTNEEDIEIDRAISYFQKKESDTEEQIKSLTFRIQKRQSKDPTETRHSSQILDHLKIQKEYCEKIINLYLDKINVKNETRTLQSIIETSIKDAEEKEKSHKKELDSLNEIIENFNENRVYNLENENRRLKEELEIVKMEKSDIELALDKKSKELTFLYADAENTKETIISELKNLKDLKNKLMQEREKFNQEKQDLRRNNNNTEKEAKSGILKLDPIYPDEDNSKIKGKSRFIEYIEKSNKESPLSIHQPIMIKDLQKENGKSLYYQEPISDKSKGNLSHSESNFTNHEDTDDQANGLNKLREMIQNIKNDQEKLVIESDLIANAGFEIPNKQKFSANYSD